MQVKKERTNWRDDSLIKFHRDLGIEMSAKGVDFLLLEYDLSKPIALIDYKQVYEDFDFQAPSNAIIDVSNSYNQELPYFIVYYSFSNNQFNDFYVYGANDVAKKQLGNIEYYAYSEEEFVSLLYDIRGRNISKENVLPLNTPSKVNSTWNGELISNRHRDYGWNCAAVDIDLVLENIYGKACAIFEFKHNFTTMTVERFSNHPTGRALNDLSSNRAIAIPFFIVKYDSQFSGFEISALNEIAINLIPTKTKKFILDEYIDFLNNLRSDDNE